VYGATIHASKTDREGRGCTRYLGAPTVAAVQRWMLLATTVNCTFVTGENCAVVGP